jgi:hypothetical protein
MNMKYLKLFEGYKEFSDSLNELNLKHKEDMSKIVDDYKSLVDDLLLDISDDYEVEFNRVITSLSGHITEDTQVLLYYFYFSVDKIDDFFDRLKDVLYRMEGAGISYNLGNLRDVNSGKILPYTYGKWSHTLRGLEFVRDQVQSISKNSNISKFSLSISF